MRAEAKRRLELLDSEQWPVHRFGKRRAIRIFLSSMAFSCDPREPTMNPTNPHTPSQLSQDATDGTFPPMKPSDSKLANSKSGPNNAKSRKRHLSRVGEERRISICSGGLMKQGNVRVSLTRTGRVAAVDFTQGIWIFDRLLVPLSSNTSSTSWVCSAGLDWKGARHSESQIYSHVVMRTPNRNQ